MRIPPLAIRITMTSQETAVRRAPWRWTWFILPPVLLITVLCAWCGPFLIREVIVRRLRSLGATVTYDMGVWHHERELTGLQTWGLNVKRVQFNRLAPPGHSLPEISTAVRQLDAPLLLDLTHSENLNQDLEHLALVPRLDLVLTGRHLEKETLTRLSRITGLTSLNLSDCRFDNADFASLKNLRELTFLTLDHTPINDDGLLQLASLKNLLSVSLSNTQVSDSAKEALCRAIPNLNLADD